MVTCSLDPSPGLVRVDPLGLLASRASSRVHMPPPPRSKVIHYLGLGATVRPLNVVARSSSALLSISFLVFLNGIQPFFLTTVLHVPSESLGTTTGNLILADELLALLLVFVWGAVSDRITVRWVAVLGHLFVGLGVWLYTVSRSVYPGVLGARLVFSVSRGRGTHPRRF